MQKTGSYEYVTDSQNNGKGHEKPKSLTTDQPVLPQGLVIKSCIVCNLWPFNFKTNVSIFQEHSKNLKFRYPFYQFRKS